MFFRFARDGRPDRVFQFLIADSPSQQRTQFHPVFLAEAEIKRAVGGQAHTVAAGAEVLRDRRDEADAQIRAGHAHVTRGTAARHDGRHQVESFRQPAADIFETHVMIAGGAAGVAHGHGLDQPQREILLDAELHHVLDLVVVDVLHHHHVDLDRMHAGPARGRQPIQHLDQFSAAGDGGEAFGLERIEADVDALHAGLKQGQCVFFQLHGVGAEGQILQARQRMQSRGQVGQMVARQRFAAGEAHAAHAEFGEGAYRALDLVEREPVFRFGKIPIVRRQAIHATQIATIGDGQTDVFNRPVEGVDQPGFHVACNYKSTRRRCTPWKLCGIDPARIGPFCRMQSWPPTFIPPVTGANSIGRRYFRKSPAFNAWPFTPRLSGPSR